MEKLPPWCVVLLVLVVLVRGSDVVRETAYGKVRGKVREVSTAAGVKQVEVFLGVPYARSPAGTRRFSTTASVHYHDSINHELSPREAAVSFDCQQESGAEFGTVKLAVKRACN
ncbi:Hypp4388 [Branchiostoma lanceolatum]|uniref:Hypp4388 protein n=1 Tax=Branchiostoma lanceolatum TaxID=7740 RepID=A0A8K0A7G5_BRALA|nr:Hypp4388 [Branchiostoma lanceolatum]